MEKLIKFSKSVLTSSSQERRKENPQKNTKIKRKTNERGRRIDTEVHQVDPDDGTDNRMDPGAHHINTSDGTGDVIDPELCQVDRQTIKLPRMVGARGKHPIRPLWEGNRIYLGASFRPKDVLLDYTSNAKKSYITRPLPTLHN